MTTPRLLALSDLHVAFPPNREIVSALRPGDDGLVAAASHLFDGPARPEATARFLAEDGHHLLVAY